METLVNNQSMESMSQGPGMYRLKDAKLRNKISYPWAPNLRLQKMGGSVFEENFIDVESELNRLNKESLDYQRSNKAAIKLSSVSPDL